MGELAVRALRAVLAAVLATAVLVQALMVWALVAGRRSRRTGRSRSTALRVITILGLVSVGHRGLRMAAAETQ